MATIVGRSGQYKGLSIPIPPGGLTLGREKSGNGRLAFDDDTDVSREHCVIDYDRRSGHFRVTDLGSINGTFLIPGDHRLADREEVACDAGQLIRIGPKHVFELTVDQLDRAAPDPRPAPAQERTPAQVRAAPVKATGPRAVSPAASPLPADSPLARAAYEAPEPAPVVQEQRRPLELPRLAEGQRLDIPAIRMPYERFYLTIIWIVDALILLAVVPALLFFGGLSNANWLIVVGLIAWFTFFAWLGWRFLLAHLLGHAIRVGPTQYPQIDVLVNAASELLGIKAPTVFVLQGHGVFEVFVARRFWNRGVLLITSNMLDDLTETGSSRELMFFIGRQLGLIAAGYFNLWFFKHLLGRFSTLFFLAWERRCHMTADRLGLLVTGDLLASEQALVIITAGSGVAPNTNLQAIKEQRTELFDGFWSWIALGLSSYPYMVDRIIRLREFAAEAARRGIEGNAPVAIGALRIHHHPIRALPLMIVHGHDRTARLELENFLRRKFPHVEPVLMIDETDAANTLPEKFERLARSVKGALVLLTPDDIAMAQSDRKAHARARQNVIVEIGWIWAHFGRQKLLLLTRGELEMPSDLSGVEAHRYGSSPIECSEVVRDFIARIEMS